MLGCFGSFRSAPHRHQRSGFSDYKNHRAGMGGVRGGITPGVYVADMAPTGTVATGADAASRFPEMCQAVELTRRHLDATFAVPVEAVPGLVHYVDLIERMRIIARACKAARDRAADRAMHRPEASAWFADLVASATFGDDVPWYSTEVDAHFQVVPIPISASPRVPNGPPALAPVLLNADTQGYRAA